MNKFDSAAILLGHKREDQSRVQVYETPMGRAPRLNDETLRNDLEDRPGKDVVEGAERSASRPVGRAGIVNDNITLARGGEKTLAEAAKTIETQATPLLA